MGNNEKKIAIVTGGSKGIGRAIALELARHNYYVIINYKSDTAAAQETLGLISSEGMEGQLCRFDVSDSEETKEAIGQIVSQFDNIEILINNAGISADGLFVMMPEKNWDTVITTTLKGFYNTTKPILKRMITQKRGSIVSISSVAGLIGNRGQANYSAAKAGLIGASRSVATEVARLGIRVNVVAPGLIQTGMIKDAPVDMIKKMIPMARIGQPEDVARVVRFLCSDDASYITGQVISVNGGMF
ncbi:MAG: 3-oxoacyl-ACP reductase FabG [Deltaproteobacteria bacterium]|nr:3-oxoacyl-ACP reductase FabG [Deltaproteobacteria bacterium]